MIRAPRSLLARILLWHGVAVAFTALAVSAGVYFFLELTADQLERQTLRAQVVEIRKVLATDGEGTLRIGSANSAARPLLSAGMSALIVDEGGTRTVLVGAPPALAVARLPREADETFFRRRSRRAFYAGLSVPIMIGQQRLWLVTLQNLDHPANVMDDIVRQFLWHGLFVIVPLLVMLLGVDAYIVRRALRPVRRASALVERIDAGQSGTRIVDPTIPSEVQPLANAINMALARLTHSLRMQRDFTADAAHELRTPITIARVRAAEIPDAVLRAALIADLDALSGIVGQLLDIAELDSLDQVAMERINLSQLARQAVAAIAPLVFRSGRTIALLGAERAHHVLGHPQFLARALGALLENAVAHTPPGTTIRVTVEDAMVRVADDGPGIAPADQDLVFQRFWRRDRGQSPSGGLGLAIVQRVAQVHGGSVTLRSEPGFTEFALTIPATSVTAHPDPGYGEEAQSSR